MAQTADELRHIYPLQQALLDRWMMIGYRQWYKRKYLKKPKDSKELAANKALKSMDDLNWKQLKTKVKSRLK